MQIRYDSDLHKYTDETGREIKSVTTIIKEAGLSTDYSNIPQDVLEYARVRGEYVQKAVDLFDDGQLDYNTLDDRLKPYLDQWIKFKQEYNVTVIHNRKIVSNEEYLYCGEMDKKIKLGNLNEEAVIDIKCTSKIHDNHLWQVSAYDYADGLDDKKSNPLIVQLTDKKFNVREAKEEHRNIFLACALISKVKSAKQS